MKRNATRLATALLIVGAMSSVALGQATVVTWDGGNGSFDAAKWNGGQDAATVFGDVRMTNGAFDVTIGGGSTVTYVTPTIGDGIRPRSDVGPTSITIKEGATFWQTTAPDGDEDGMWTTFDADLILDNGTFRRDWTPGGDAMAGGILMFGSWRSVQDQRINISTINGGKIENDGQIWFGADEEHASGIKVLATIDDGTWDLTGGAFPTSNNDSEVTAELAFFYGYDLVNDVAKGEEYEINFQGPGSLTVDQGGIVVYRQDNTGVWNHPQGEGNGNLATRSTYENLWEQGILRSHGMSGNDGAGGATALDFNNFFTTTGTSGSADYKVTAKTSPTVAWDGGNGAWNDAKWNGGQDATMALGRNNGSEGPYEVVIGGGAQVLYQADVVDEDFRLLSRNGNTRLTVKEGAKLTLDSFNTDVDGKWTEIDGDLTLDNGTLDRGFTAGGSTVSGGALIFGSWRSRQNQQIDVNVTNGARLENDGQLWFGAGIDQGRGIEVTMTIDNGHLDLTGGANYDIVDLDEIPDNGTGEGDLTFFFARDVEGTDRGHVSDFSPLDESYAINFTGGGSITVDSAGIYVYTQLEDGTFDGVTTKASYLDLWNKGILQANGLSGLDGATFGDFFSVTGAVGANDYKLTSLMDTGLAGDFDGNGSVDGADFLTWQRGFGTTYDAGDLADWKANFGQSGSAGAVGAVPEPASLALAALAMGAAWAARRRVR